MRSGPFAWTMRHGAKILFVVAIIQFAATVLPSLVTLLASTREMAGNHYYQPANDSMLLQLSIALQGIGSFALTLFAALVVDRMDRWLASRGTSERDQ
ncbi:MAG: hypothetical protein QOI38_1911 [Sphingomonadales bacterium]|nr:hypothetical protein [Sphingomonadales bacterium]